jgi:hypothetical protein
MCPLHELHTKRDGMHVPETTARFTVGGSHDELERVASDSGLAMW